MVSKLVKRKLASGPIFTLLLRRRGTRKFFNRSCGEKEIYFYAGPPAKKNGGKYLADLFIFHHWNDVAPVNALDVARSSPLRREFRQRPRRSDASQQRIVSYLLTYSASSWKILHFFYFVVLAFLRQLKKSHGPTCVQLHQRINVAHQRCALLLCYCNKTFFIINIIAIGKLKLQQISVATKISVVVATDNGLRHVVAQGKECKAFNRRMHFFRAPLQ